MKQLRKSIALVLVVVYTVMGIPISFAAYATSDYSFYVTQNGNAKEADSVIVELPALDNPEYIIRKIDLKIFQRSDPSFTYGDYTLNGVVKNIEIYEPTTLKYIISFGNVTDYETQSTYKIAYRYTVSPIDDESQFIIAGEDFKDGWRLAGEPTPTVATSTGLAFYVDKIDESGGSGDSGDEDDTENGLVLEDFEPINGVSHTVAGWDGDKPLYITNSNSTTWTLEFNELLKSSEVTITIENADKSVSYSKSYAYTSDTVNMAITYSDELNNKLPDGMYYIYVSASTTDDVETRSLDKTYVAQLALKRITPDMPVITQDATTKEITITYPIEDNVFPEELKDLVLKEYKFLPDSLPSGGYEDYTGSFTVDKDGTITAKYTDFAGNTSTATDRVEDSSGDDETSAESSGAANAHKEGNRQANVYYINTRRESNVGINSEIFKFLE